MGNKKLTKISNKRKISGVCAGMSEYTKIDVSIIRLLWIVALFVFNGAAVIVYFILAMILPENEISIVNEDVHYSEKKDDNFYGEEETVETVNAKY